MNAEAFAAQTTVDFARGLLGRWLVVQAGPEEPVRRRITETEAYDGPRDLACHASRGRTARTEVLFGPPGHWYVYLCYGIHELLNLVVGPVDYPAAVLIRGVEGLDGPGKLTRTLGIDRRFNRRIAAPETGLWLEDDGFSPPAAEISITPRIGIDYAGPEWAAKPWRFVWAREAPRRGRSRAAPSSNRRR